MSMNIQMLPQLCVHLIGSFIEDEIAKQKKVIKAEYMLDRAIEMSGEIKDYAENVKLSKKELSIMGSGLNWGKARNYDASTFKRLREIIWQSHQSSCALKKYYTKNPNGLKRDFYGLVESNLRYAYLKYSAYEFVKAQRPKRTPIQLKNRDGTIVNAWLIE